MASPPTANEKRLALIAIAVLLIILGSLLQHGAKSAPTPGLVKLVASKELGAEERRWRSEVPQVCIDGIKYEVFAQDSQHFTCIPKFKYDGVVLSVETCKE